MRNYAKLFVLINTVKNIFPVSQKFPCVTTNSLCFPCLEKVRTKFPVFPVLLPPCFSMQETWLCIA